MLLDTRIQMYQNLKNKSSMPLPRDPDSVVQVIKRAHFQTFTWIRCCERIVDHLPFKGNGWMAEAVDEKLEVKPLWYTGSQLPLLPSKTDKSAVVVDGSVADVESVVDENQPRRKKRKTRKKQHDESDLAGMEVDPVDDSKMIDSGAEADESCVEAAEEQGNNDWQDRDSDWERWEEEDFMSNEQSNDKWLP